MAYPALIAARRKHYEIDGTVAGFNRTALGNGMSTLLTASQMLQLNEETPTVDVNVVSDGGSTTTFWYFLFPELTDITNLIIRNVSTGGGNLASIQTSVDTTTGADGTWLTPASSGVFNTNTSTNDWWRSSPGGDAPGTLTSNNTGIVGLRFQTQSGSNATSNYHNLYMWSTKHTGATPDDIIFLKSDATTEWPNDDDWGDINAGAAGVTHQYYVKNTSGSKTANTITVKSSGSDNAQWTVSLDNASFASSKSIASLAPGATQVVYFKFTPPSPASGVYRPYAGYLEADVTSWT